MRLGLQLGYDDPPFWVGLAEEAERCGFHSVWTSEAYGSDAVSPLALGRRAHDEHQARDGDHADARALAGDDGGHRRDARLALAAAVCCSGSARPARRSRRAGTARPGASRSRGRASTSASSGRSSAARSRSSTTASTTTSRTPAPTQPGSGSRSRSSSTHRAPTCRSTSPRSGRRTSRSPRRSPTAGCRSSSRPSASRRRTGRCSRRASRRRGGRPDGWDLAAHVPIVVSDDVAAARDFLKPLLALYVGGMGAKGQNFYNRLAERYGFEEAAATHPGPLPRRPARTKRSPRCPDALVDEVSLVGDRAPDRRPARGVPRRRRHDARAPGAPAGGAAPGRRARRA